MGDRQNTIDRIVELVHPDNEGELRIRLQYFSGSQLFKSLKFAEAHRAGVEA